MKTPAKRRDLIGIPSPPPKERVPGSGLTKTGNLARPKTGGRVAGAKNKHEVSVEMMADILDTYMALGGPKWLLAWAKKNEGEFVKQALSRLFPTPPRDPEIEIQNNLTVNRDMTDLELATRIAFALESGRQAMKQKMAEEGKTVEADPKPVQPERLPWTSPWDRPPTGQVTEAELHEAVQNQQVSQLVADTRGANSDYAGSAAEQGFSRKRSLY